MDHKDLGQVRKENHEFRKLEEEHHRMEQTLAEISRRKVLTPEEEIRKKRLQKKKLATKDRMVEILREHEHRSDPARRQMKAG
jgi:uncharacterized protein YdcH (DUF465 family)